MIYFYKCVCVFAFDYDYVCLCYGWTGYWISGPIPVHILDIRPIISGSPNIRMVVCIILNVFVYTLLGRLLYVIIHKVLALFIS